MYLSVFCILCIFMCSTWNLPYYYKPWFKQEQKSDVDNLLKVCSRSGSSRGWATCNEDFTEQQWVYISARKYGSAINLYLVSEPKANDSWVVHQEWPIYTNFYWFIKLMSLTCSLRTLPSLNPMISMASALFGSRCMSSLPGGGVCGPLSMACNNI